MAGTFDPVHAGHLQFARQAARQCHLEAVYFLPEAEPRGKARVTAFQHRVAMLGLALKSTAWLEVLTLPEARFEVATTWPQLQACFPGKRLAFLVGSDVATRLSPISWPGVATMGQSADLIVGLRDNQPADSLTHLTNYFAVEFVTTNRANLAAGDVRAGRAHYANKAVEVYAMANRLYGKPAGSRRANAP